MHASAVPVWIGPQSNLNWIFTQSNAQRLSGFTSQIVTLFEIHKKAFELRGNALDAVVFQLLL